MSFAVVWQYLTYLSTIQSLKFQMLSSQIGTQTQAIIKKGEIDQLGQNIRKISVPIIFVISMWILAERQKQTHGGVLMAVAVILFVQPKVYLVEQVCAIGIILVLFLNYKKNLMFEYEKKYQEYVCMFGD